MAQRYSAIFCPCSSTSSTVRLDFLYRKTFLLDVSFNSDPWLARLRFFSLNLLSQLIILNLLIAVHNHVISFWIYNILHVYINFVIFHTMVQKKFYYLSYLFYYLNGRLKKARKDTTDLTCTVSASTVNFSLGSSEVLRLLNWPRLFFCARHW